MLAHLMQALDELPFPTVAPVQGAAYGGALGLVCACDIVLASENARFCLRGDPGTGACGDQPPTGARHGDAPGHAATC